MQIFSNANGVNMLIDISCRRTMVNNLIVRCGTTLSGCRYIINLSRFGLSFRI